MIAQSMQTAKRREVDQVIKFKARFRQITASIVSY